ncbi:MAG: hypothetical protein VZR02_02415 [Lachnospiraceae bacterium]|nr:hypothetical protein [Lachnospiraceae bacterium]
MKGLMKYLSPMAPDISGAVSVLFDKGGMIVILDAGGCTGNVCGFDEPRWMSYENAPGSSVIFSAGLRDMDAIFGRDDRLLKKTGAVINEIHPRFLALIGSPVPSVIGTDFRGLRRMAENRFGVPVITVPVTGMDLYDRGEKLAYKAWLEAFPWDGHVIGAAPLNLLPKDTPASLLARAQAMASLPAPLGDSAGPREGLVGDQLPAFADTVGTGDGSQGSLPRGAGRTIPSSSDAAPAPASLCQPPDCTGPMANSQNCSADSMCLPSGGWNLAVSPSALFAAEKILTQDKIPYRAFYPLPEWLCHRLDSLSSSTKPVLVVHQAVLAESIRAYLRGRGCQAEIRTGTWFTPLDRTDFHFRDEEDFETCLRDGHFGTVLADPLLARAAHGQYDRWVDLAHFAVSGQNPPHLMNS